MGKRLVGEVTHYFSNIDVAVVKVTDKLKTRDKVSIEGSTTNFSQPVDSMQVDKDPIEEATAGQEVGMKVKDRVREGDKVYVLEEEEEPAQSPCAQCGACA